MEAQQETEKGLVADAIAAAKELRAANAERLLLLEREERLHAERVLSGSAHAGQAPPPVKEETPLEYKDRVMRGEY